MSASRITCLCVVMLLGGLSFSPARGQEAATDKLPTIADEPRTVDPAQFLPAPLRKLVTVDFSESSLAEVVEWLRSEQGLVVVMEEEALREIGYLPGDPLSDKLVDQPLYLLLNRLRSVDMAWYYEDDILHITSASVAGQHITTQPYNIGKHLDAGYTPDSLIDSIISTIATDSWTANGGSAGDVSLLGDVLFVRQSDTEHIQLQGLLEALLNNGRRTLIADPVQHQQIHEQLASDISAKFRDTPLEEAIAQLAAESGADLRLDQQALEGLRIRSRQPITITISDRPLSTVLQAILLDLKLTYVIQDGVVWITSQDKADKVLKTAVFDVRDLCRDEFESDALIDAILSQTSDVWVENGNPEADLRSVRPGTLVVYAAEPILDEVLQLLESYRTALRSSKPREETKPVDMNEVITVYYRMDTAMAESLNPQLMFMVAPESWEGAQADGQGKMYLVASASDPYAKANRGEGASGLQMIPKSVLVITNTRKVHEEIREVLNRIEYGDNNGGFGGKSGGMGGGGGGFGGGFFAVPENQQP